MSLENAKLMMAYYTHEDRTNCRAEWMKDDGNIYAEDIRPEPGSALWEDLLEHCDLEDIQDWTFQYQHESRKGFEEDVIEVARKEGLVWDVRDADAMELYKGFAKAIFDNDWENDKLAKEKLFCFKLQVFELNTFKKSKNKELKSQLRKCQNMIEAVTIACQIHQEMYS